MFFIWRMLELAINLKTFGEILINKKAFNFNSVEKHYLNKCFVCEKWF
jgi:hypothetical protein